MKINNLSGEREEQRFNLLYRRVSGHIDRARQNVQRAIDTEMVKAYWLIGRDIVEEEQQGKQKSQYGTYLIKTLSHRLTQAYGTGLGISTLKDVRRFYLEYQCIMGDGSIGHTLCGQLEPAIFTPRLSWSHYRILMRVSKKEARHFYKKEAAENKWSSRELKRQINSLLFDRFDKEIKQESDNPTLGLILCTENDDLLVKYMLDEKAKQIFSSKYQFHLPSEEELTTELRKEISEIKQQQALIDPVSEY